ncbi:MAG: three-Cys-motif partner protein TcmP [Candidatus Omnitrophota bacterium]
MSIDSFFDETKEQSVVKTNIVAKYFQAWTNVIIPSTKKYGQKIAYIDLFAGPGRYKDGTNSTPLIVLEKAIRNADLCEMLVTMFNDRDQNKTKTLERAIAELPGINNLKHKPKVYNQEVGSEIVKMFNEVKLVPTLFFVDPWGYKGLSLGLINSVLKDWGCDCIIFFNYNRINMGLSNPAFKEHMDALFDELRADQLRAKLYQLKPHEREFAIVEEIVKALQEMGGKYVLPFCFKNQQGTRTSHHLIFVSKNFKGYEIMKEIMASESTKVNQGVPSFTYCPADEQQQLLFEFTRPLNQLADMLLEEYASKTIAMKNIYKEHSVGRPYLSRNYKDVLAQLEADGKIIVDPPSAKRRRIKGKITFGDNVLVEFPKRRS